MVVYSHHYSVTVQHIGHEASKAWQSTNQNNAGPIRPHTQWQAQQNCSASQLQGYFLMLWLSFIVHIGQVHHLGMSLHSSLHNNNNTINNTTKKCKRTQQLKPIGPLIHYRPDPNNHHPHSISITIEWIQLGEIGEWWWGLFFIENLCSMIMMIGLMIMMILT